MKKKTKMFYFFKMNYKDPASFSMFFFFKRAIRQRKKNKILLLQFKNDKKRRMRRKPKPEGIYQPIARFKRYKFITLHRLTYNRWLRNHEKLIHAYITSYYRNRLFKNKRSIVLKPRKQLQIWFALKINLYQQLLTRIKLFTRAGNTPFVHLHALVKKNKTYFVKAKYRPKTFNLSRFNDYVHSTIYWILLMLKYIRTNLFFFTANCSKTSKITDGEFNVFWTNWQNFNIFFKNLNLKSVIFKNETFFNITLNWSDYTNRELRSILLHRDEILTYFNETDKQKKELLLVPIKNKLSVEELDIVFSLKLFLYLDIHEGYPIFLYNTLIMYRDTYIGILLCN